MTGLHLALFVFYLILFCFLIRKSRAYRHPLVGKNLFTGIFLLRVMAGLIYGYIYSRPAYLINSDAWRVFQASLTQYRLLLHDPLTFLKTSFFFEGNISLTNFTQTDSSYWNILKEVLFVKFEALLNLASFGNYYVNTVLFSFLLMSGSNAFFRLLEKNFASRSYLNLFSAFLVPSTIFWTSAIYKDGILLILMFAVFAQTQIWLDKQQSLAGYLLVTMFCLIALFFLRTYCALLIIPVLIIWIADRKLSIAPWKSLVTGLAVVLFLTGLLAWLMPSSNPLVILASWQQAFMEMPANSALPARALQPDVPGLLQNFPQAFNFGFLRPLLWENKGLQYLPFAMELCILQLLFLYVLIRRSALNTLALCLLVLGMSGLLFLGYTVNIIGALIRYRSIYMPFLFAALTGALPQGTISKICRFRLNR